MKLLLPPVYLLHVDGGEFAVRSSIGDRCLFVFTSIESISAFTESLNLPSNCNIAFIELTKNCEVLSLIAVAKSSATHIAVDPHSESSFAPANLNDLVEFRPQDN